MANDELEAAESIRYHPVMAAAAPDLARSALLLEFVVKASEFIPADVLVRLSLAAAEYGCVLGHLHFDGESLERLPAGAPIDEGEKFADVVPVRDHVDMADVEGRVRGVYGPE